MRYLSVCSGIEAATVAWHPLGWTPVAFSEIEPFPSAVLAHHYPQVTNLGDMTNHAAWPLQPGDIDILVGGTPCQSFSVAGLRKGLSDPRGGLMLTYLEIARRLRPRWVVWENVPGVLSSDGGRDFGSFLGALGELGYGWAYRVLDAQWVRTQRHPRAVPQRRRRVFVVGCLGNARAPAAVLFERESVQRDSSPRRAKGEGAAADASDGAGAGQWWDGSDCAATLTKKNADGAQRMPDKDNLGAVLQPIVIDRAAFNQGENAQYDPVIREDDAMPSMVARGPHAVAVPFRKSKLAQSTTDDESWVEAEQANTLNAFDTGERDTHAVAFKPGQSAAARSMGAQEEVACTLEGGGGGNNRQAVAIGTDMYNHAITGDVAATMGTPGSSVNASGTTVMQAYPINGMCLNKELRDKQMTGIGEDGDAMYTVRADGTQHAVGFNWQNAGGYGNANEGLGITVEGTGPLQRCQTPAVAFSCKDHGADAANVAPSLTASNDPSRSPQSAEVTQQVAAVHAATMTVRRLTPRECERLQAFPDDYTLIPWRKKSADQCPDGPRYKALGNSMAVNCMEWIGERIAAYKAKERKP